MNQSTMLFKGAFILTIAALLTKILSAFYRIPFQNIVGDIGFYIYQQVYPFYGIAIVLSTTGFPVVISKLYAEQMEKGDDEKSRLLLFVSFVYLQVIGFLLFLILYGGADHIAGWMKDPQLAVLFKVISIVFLIFPFVSIIRGYYQAIGEMTPTALSQVGEQTIRVLTIIFLSSLFMEKGFSLYFVGGGAMVGSITGSMVASLILFMFLQKRKEWKGMAPSKGIFQNNSLEVKRIVKMLTFQGLMICLSGMLMIFMQLADSLNLFSLLVSSGTEREAAKSLKGVFDRGQPLIQLGTVAAASMALTLVPLISRERLATKSDNLTRKIQVAIKVSIVIGLGASSGLWAIIEPTNIMLFENGNGSDVLGVLSFVVLFTSVISTIIAIMQGLGNLLYPALAVMLIFPLKYLLNMMFIPLLGTMGAAVSSLMALGLVTFCLVFKFKKMIAVPLFTYRILGIVLTAAITMVVVLKGYLYVTNPIIAMLESDRLGAALQALSAVLLGGSLFLVIIIRGNVFLEEDLREFPFGSKLIHLLSRKDKE
ncbi:putative polysaccharide biosynthesis protein [Neobacillus sp. 19]|uniref:putative polysaccharide biosynthesis protein n=1 Tax=Neobacillus sp. 19 TaxID=3394458 RepID=UPI003BF62DDB